MIRVDAPGKLVLLGEYAVIEGAPALVAAVDRRIRVTAVPSRGRSAFHVRAPELGIDDAAIHVDVDASGEATSRVRAHDRSAAERLGLVCRVLESAAADAKAERRVLPPLHLTIDTSDFFRGVSKLGLGSSAPAAAARPGASRESIFEGSLAAHRRAQGSAGSGVDIAASTFGGILSYRRDQMPQATALPDGIEVLPVFTGQSASTGALVKRVQEAAENDGPARPVLDGMHRLAERAESVCREGDAATFLDIVREYHESYLALGSAAGVELVTEAHRSLAEGLASSEVAYKPSGAGGGDVGLVFSGAGSMTAIRQRVVECGGIPLALRLGDAGLTVD